MSKAAATVVSIGLTVVVLGCAGGSGESASEPASTATAEPAAASPAAEAVARIEPTSGSEVTGTATFMSVGGQVTFTLVVENAPAGEHAFHIHEIGDCSSPDGKSAGGHWNPTDEDHGRWGVPAFHLGDVGNLLVGEDGRGSLVLTTDLWSIGTGETSDIVGRAVILHADADDFTTQPTGAAGGRIGCGVIE
jgi:Cu-Zn family superoxide dismutase